jgi:chemotaxis protein MotB
MRWIVLTLALSLLSSWGCVGKKKYDALQTNYDAANASLAQRDARVSELEAQVAEWQKKANDLENERATLLMDQSKLNTSIDEMKRALAELDQRKAAAEARLSEYRELLGKFKKLIDAGKLKVKIVDGRMVVELATDVLFDSGSAKLSDAGKAAIVEVSQVLATIPERNFQVEGHTDNVPIATAQYPSNWELASSRALTVVKTMVEAGMPSTRISASSYGETKPVQKNDSAEGKSANRRIEIVVVPDLSDLPGFEELSKVSSN